MYRVTGQVPVCTQEVLTSPDRVVSHSGAGSRVGRRLRIGGQRCWRGRGAYSFASRLRRLIIDCASHSRRSTAPTANTRATSNVWAPVAFFHILHEKGRGAGEMLLMDGGRVQACLFSTCTWPTACAPPPSLPCWHRHLDFQLNPQGAFTPDDFLDKPCGHRCRIFSTLPPPSAFHDVTHM